MGKISLSLPLLAVFCVIVLCSASLWAAEIVVREELSADLSDLTLRRSPKKDASGRDCALVKVSTDLSPFDKVEANQYIVDIEHRTGEVWIYLSSDERRLYFTKEGYDQLIYDIPVRIESNKVYRMKIMGSGIVPSKALPVTFMIDPPEALLEIGGTIKDHSRPVPLMPGEYRITISKPGYKSRTVTINVNSESVYFPYTLEAKDPVRVRISSEPEGIDFYINNMPEGKTPKEPWLIPGEYSVALRKQGFIPVDAQITVSELSENMFHYRMEKASSRLLINLDPSDATLLINNQVRQERSFELAPGTYRIEARKEGYDSVNKTISIQAGKDHTENLVLVRQTGKLIFTVEPMNAEIALSNGDKWLGSNFLTLPAGSYSITVSFAGYKTENRNFLIEKNRDTKLDVVLSRISPPAEPPIVRVSEEPAKAPPKEIPKEIPKETPKETPKAKPRETISYAEIESRANQEAIELSRLEDTEKELLDEIERLNHKRQGDPKPPVANVDRMVFVEGGDLFIRSGLFGKKTVTLNSFYMGQYEVTQEEYLSVMGTNPSWLNYYPNRPVEVVSWMKAVEYCNRRSIMEGISPCYSYGKHGTDPDKWPPGWSMKNTNHSNFTCNWQADGYRLP
ncbi:MAG: PEGA domain-containing protein, partial [Candidatus Cloacimonadaceae bacterium]|nr:PEGA domain-containing protein [Candidatus Cloacimonadaceae bacterium]